MREDREIRERGLDDLPDKRTNPGGDEHRGRAFPRLQGAPERFEYLVDRIHIQVQLAHQFSVFHMLLDGTLERRNHEVDRQIVLGV